MDRLTGGRRLAFAAMFFGSGAAALVYEVVWFKRFSQFFGSSSEALGAVVAAFLLGLGLGAWLCGPRAGRLRSPLKAYALCEVGIGVLALLTPFEMDLLRIVAAKLYGSVESVSALHVIARLAGAFLVLGPPTVLMGATLPLLVAHLERGGERAWRAVAFLYATNTAGAAIGCYVAGFHLLPSLGLKLTLYVAAFANLVVSLIAFVLARGESHEVNAFAADSDRAAARPLSSLNASALLFGASALCLHMVWARELALILGGTTYAFTSMLFVVLLGIGLGSLALEVGGNLVQSWERALARTALGLVFFALVAQLAIPTLSLGAGSVRVLRGSQIFNAIYCSSVSAVLEFLPALASGALLPILVRLANEGESDSGRIVGGLYAWNTVGSTLGASFTAWLVIPALGTAGGVVVACALALTGAFIATGHAAWLAPRRLAVAVGLTLLAIPVARGHDPRLTGLGVYIYGAQVAEQLADAEVVYHAEGALADVLVTGLAGDVSLRVNGKVDASTLDGDMLTQLGAAYFPRFLKPDAEDILVVGYGSGATAGASLLFPNTRVTCLEIEPAVYEASKCFEAVNHSPQSSPGFRMVFDDARSYIEGTDELYDLIITEPSNPWIPGISNLFTTEFYESLRSRLKPQGHIAQWIQTYALSVEDYARVARTLTQVFPEVLVVRMNYGDTLVIASESSVHPTVRSMTSVQHRIGGLPRVRADLVRYFGSEDVRTILLSHAVLGSEGVERLTAHAPELHTDVNLRLEFDAPLRLFSERGAPGEALARAFLDVSDAAFYRNLYQFMGCEPRHLVGLRKQVALAAKAGAEELARDLIALGLELDPDSAELSADLLIQSPPEDPAVWRTRIESLVERAPQEAGRVASSLGARRDFERALSIYDLMLERDPQSATTLANRAIALNGAGRRDDALEALRAARELDPVNETVQRALAVLPLAD